LVHVDLSSAPFSSHSFSRPMITMDQGGEEGEKERTSASVPPSKYPNPGTSNVKVHDNFCQSVFPHKSTGKVDIRDYLLV
jgi:hypothetical protein